MHKTFPFIALACALCLVIPVTGMHWFLPFKTPTQEQLNKKFFSAAQGDDTNTVKGFIEKGTNVCLSDDANNSQTALHYAAENGNVALMTFLLKHGANINARTILRERPLHLAVKNGHEGAVQALLEQKIPTTSNNKKALQEGFEEIALAPAVEIDATDLYGHTALHMCCKPHIAQLLIKNGASVQAKNNNDETPLHYAVCTNDGALVKLLIASGADVHAKDSKKNTPLLYATPKSDTFIILLAHGAFYDPIDQIDQKIIANASRLASLANIAFLINTLTNVGELIKIFPEEGAKEDTYLTYVARIFAYRHKKALSNLDETTCKDLARHACRFAYNSF